MKNFRVLFFFGLLGVVIAIARCNSKPNSRAESPTFSPPPQTIVSTTPTPAALPTTAAIVNQPPAAQPSVPPSPELQKAAERVAPGVVSISAFDESGKFLRTGTGCFISKDGRFITSSSIVQGAAHAVAKASDGRILNVSGVLADAAPLDIAVLKADTKKGVAFLPITKASRAEVGARVAVVGSALARRQPAHFEGTISARRSDPTGEWLELSAPLSNECAGWPVVNEKGELVGVVTTQRPPGAVTNVVRNADTLDTVLARIDPHVSIGWQVAQNAPNESPAPPAEGPTKFPARFAKIPLVRADQPGNSRLIHSPRPAYPTSARHSYFPLKGNGRFRVKFATNGDVKEVEVIESTRSETLDNAATDALRKWKAAPGQEWSATVPITFQP